MELTQVTSGPHKKSFISEDAILRSQNNRLRC
jgi:hypothetical protein